MDGIDKKIKYKVMQVSNSLLTILQNKFTRQTENVLPDFKGIFRRNSGKVK